MNLLAGSWRPHGLYGFTGSAKRPGFLAASIDKYAVAPLEAPFHPAGVLHIIDNSNAWYCYTSRYDKLVVTVHDMIPWRCANGMLEGWHMSRAARALLRVNSAAMHKADVLVAVSETTRRDLLAAGYDDRKIRVIANCILNPPVVPDGARWSGADLGRTFIHFGAGNYPKHSELVLEAFEHTVAADPSARLMLVGPGAERLAATISRPDAVQHFDHLRDAEIPFLYDHVLCAVMPSRYEGFGLPVLEAEERSCLIITSDGGALDEVMQDGPLKLARPISPAVLSQTMLRILGDAPFRDEMREAGRVNAQRFSRARAQAGYEEFYRGFVR